jgi:hypothetical protein
MKCALRKSNKLLILPVALKYTSPPFPPHPPSGRPNYFQHDIIFYEINSFVDWRPNIQRRHLLLGHRHASNHKIFDRTITLLFSHLYSYHHLILSLVVCLCLPIYYLTFVSHLLFLLYFTYNICFISVTWEIIILGVRFLLRNFLLSLKFAESIWN